MKRFLLAGLLLMGAGQMVSLAQNGNNKDDIYYKSSDITADNEQVDQQEAQQRARRNEDDSSYYGSQEQDNNEGYSTNRKSYNTDDYLDYDDDSYYSTRLQRFNYPFYNMGYYSMFYNPFWYDPFYFDSFGGWSYWNRPGISFSFGYGPYWNSYWGYYSWYGYPAYYSYYNYPCYSGWYDGSYYSGYWNGYYAGVNGNTAHHNITYGPRSSITTGIRGNGQRQSLGLAQQINSPRSVLRSIDLNPRLQREPAIRQPEKNISASSVSPRSRDIRFSDDAERGRTEMTPRGDDRPVRRQFSEHSDRFEQTPDARDDRAQMEDRSDMPSRQPQEDRSVRFNSPRQAPSQAQREQPRSEPKYQQSRSETRYDQPRSEPRYQQAPRMESPRMSPAPSSAPRSFGGGRR